MNIIKIIVSKTNNDGKLYDIYVNDVWQITRSSPENIFDALAEITEKTSAKIIVEYA